MKTVYVTDRDEWRRWLEHNYETEKEVWLVYYKKHTGKPAIPYDDSVEEALCFGWIDSIIKRIDEEKFVRKFTPRVNKTKWSQSNKRRVKKMIEKGKMTGAGLEKIDLDELDKGPQEKKIESIPPFLKEAFIASNVWENFNKLAPTYKRHYVGWITSAKREETRKRRIEEAVKYLRENKRLPMK